MHLSLGPSNQPLKSQFARPDSRINAGSESVSTLELPYQIEPGSLQETDIIREPNQIAINIAAAAFTGGGPLLFIARTLKIPNARPDCHHAQRQGGGSPGLSRRR